MTTMEALQEFGRAWNEFKQAVKEELEFERFVDHIAALLKNSSKARTLRYEVRAREAGMAGENYFLDTEAA